MVLTKLEENMQKIEALAELYEELKLSKPAGINELKIAKLKMKITKDEILQLSMDTKKILQLMEKEFKS